MLILILFENIAIVIGVFFLVRWLIRRNKTWHSSNATPSAPATPQQLNLDNDYFLIKNGVLLEYRGKSDNIFIPRGVRVIGDSEDKKICNMTIDTIWIPNSVYAVRDFALPYVESVHYEGNEESLHYDKNCNFFAGGWVTDWSKSSNFPIKVDSVRFDFNFTLYDKIAEKHYENNPYELSPIRIATNDEVTAMIEEAILVLNDLFDIGPALHLLDSDFNGLIVPIIKAVPPFENNKAVLKIAVVPSFHSNLFELINRQQHLRRNNEELFLKLDLFMNKYSAYCASDEFRYETVNSVTANFGNDREIQIINDCLKKYLYEQIGNLCEKADVSGEFIYTKGVYHD